MDESLKQLISIVIVVVVGVFLITFVNGDFKTSITESISEQITKVEESA